MSLKVRILMHMPALVGYTIGALLFAGATALAWPFVAWWWPLLDGLPVVAFGAAFGALAFASYLVWGLSLLLIIVVVRVLTRLSVPAGTHPLRSWATTRFFVYNLLVMVARYFFLWMTRATQINVAFYRGMGADIGRSVIMNSTHVYDLNQLTIGDHATIGGSSVIMAHMGQGDDMYIAPIEIGENASIGEAAIIFPGAKIGAGAVIGAGSVVPRDTIIPPGTKWSGVPATRVGDQRSV